MSTLTGRNLVLTCKHSRIQAPNFCQITRPVNDDISDYTSRRIQSSTHEMRSLDYGDAPHLLHQMHRTELRGPTNRARLNGMRAGHTEMHGELGNP